MLAVLVWSSGCILCQTLQIFSFLHYPAINTSSMRVGIIVYIVRSRINQDPQFKPHFTISESSAIKNVNYIPIRGIPRYQELDIPRHNLIVLLVQVIIGDHR